jgi:peptidoglycan LD-endopeptidase LytH
VLHARPGVALRRRLLPAVLAAVSAVALGGLLVLAPATAETDVDVVAFANGQPVALVDLSELERERDVARASRGQCIAEDRAAAEAQAAAEAAAAQAAAEAAAAAEAEARAKAEAEKAAAAEAAAKAKAEQAAAQKAKAAAAPTSGGAACPVPNATFTDTYGAPRSGGRTHQGIDLMAPHGTPAYAVVSGRVRTASSSLGGISLYIDGDNGETYFYAHNASNTVSTGQRVSAGDLVAKVGSTGNANGNPHVHFERQVGGRSVNPYDFLRRLC